ncbi:hypothetical protein KTO58_27645 [Chitinophaga pendula]|uniref:hypothetical protein n=1 Tax=Chitinophaga TaxID=79328 RepID=UPI0012FD310E|nr:MULTISPECIES: hypothetical protein [Chitinophaga]UCJ07391.1 hypothetical protein KTO58_27645 [Chitinophaga pendula]
MKKMSFETIRRNELRSIVGGGNKKTVNASCFARCSGSGGCVEGTCFCEPATGSCIFL